MVRLDAVRALAFSTVAAAALWLVPARANANGRFPAAQHVMIGPGHESRVIALRTTFGFVISVDNGASFHWMCEQALGFAGGVFDPPFVVDASSQLRLALFDGLGTLSADGCSLARQSTLEGMFMADLDVTQDGQRVAAVSSSGNPGAANRVYVADGTGPFRGLGAGVAGVLFSTLEMARTNPQRVYLTGVSLGESRPVFYRSNDGGTTLEELPFDTGLPIRAAFVAAIDPLDADVVYVRGTVPTLTDAEAVVPTVLLRSDDAGVHWQEIARSRDAMLGFAISDDGNTLWFGGKDHTDGLQRSTDRGVTWSRIGDEEVLCLRQHEGVLYLCANYVRDHFALARSSDQGTTFQPLLRFEDLQPPFTCPAESPTTMLCGPQWPSVRSMFVVSMDAGVDGGADAGTTGMDGSCRCAVPGAPRSRGLRSMASGIATALAAYAASRRRRSR